MGEARHEVFGRLFRIAEEFFEASFARRGLRPLVPARDDLIQGFDHALARAGARVEDVNEQRASVLRQVAEVAHLTDQPTNVGLQRLAAADCLLQVVGPIGEAVREAGQEVGARRRDAAEHGDERAEAVCQAGDRRTEVGHDAFEDGFRFAGAQRLHPAAPRLRGDLRRFHRFAGEGGEQ